MLNIANHQRNANQNHNEVSSTPVRKAFIKKSTDNKRWRGCGEKGTLMYHWWECKLMQPLWKTAWRFFQKPKIDLPYESVILLLGIYLEKTKTVIWKDTCTPVFIVALFTIAMTWKQPSVYQQMVALGRCGIYMYIWTISHKKEWNIAIYSNMDGPREYHTK